MEAAILKAALWMAMYLANFQYNTAPVEIVPVEYPIETRSNYLTRDA